MNNARQNFDWELEPMNVWYCSSKNYLNYPSFNKTVADSFSIDQQIISDVILYIHKHLQCPCNSSGSSSVRLRISQTRLALIVIPMPAPLLLLAFPTGTWRQQRLCTARPACRCQAGTGGERLMTSSRDEVMTLPHTHLREPTRPLSGGFFICFFVLFFFHFELKPFPTSFTSLSKNNRSQRTNIPGSQI